MASSEILIACSSYERAKHIWESMSNLFPEIWKASDDTMMSLTRKDNTKFTFMPFNINKEEENDTIIRDDTFSLEYIARDKIRQI